VAHAYGAAFDNPDLLVACVVGDGEAETGPLATAWHSNKFLNPATDGAVLPILHLNGFKIANPTILARLPRRELECLFEGYGYEPIFLEGDDPTTMHRAMTDTLDTILDRIASIQSSARTTNTPPERPRWPILILKTPKGWTGPKEVDGLKTEGSWRAHQVPISDVATNPQHLMQLERWMKSYQPDQLFDAEGRLRADLAALAPRGDRRMGANPHANGGLLIKDLRLPDFEPYAVQVEHPGQTVAESTRVLGNFLRDTTKRSQRDRNFRIVAPDELASNRLGAVLDVTHRVWEAERFPDDDADLGPQGQVMEVLSETTCQGWLEGYLLTGRHGLFTTYEAFVHIVDSMFNQHAKWLESSKKIGWRAPVASLTYLLSSHVWRQDHNGFSHQDPGFIDLAMNKKADVIRVYLPPDANTLLSVMDHCLRSRDYVNIVVAGKQPALQYLDMESAIKHCTTGIGIWEWASNDRGSEPDVVMGCAGDIPSLEVLAAVDLLRHEFPDLKIRVVNVVDLMRLQPREEHPHGLPDRDFDSLFTSNRPVVFAYHGYPWLIHRLTYRRTNHDNFHVRGYKEEGTTTTPFHMAVLNDMDRFHLAIDVIDRVPRLAGIGAYAKQAFVDRLTEHRRYIERWGDDPPEIRDWKWPQDQK
jgi:xylulose-5-phosphate/fructose-6-phosphate phosphoketolase